MAFGAIVNQQHDFDFTIFFNPATESSSKQVVRTTTGEKFKGTESEAVTEADALGGVSFNSPGAGDVTVVQASAKRIGGSAWWSVQVTTKIYYKAVLL